MKKNSKTYANFKNNYRNRNLDVARKVAIFATICYLLFFVLDVFLAKNHLTEIITIRIASSLLLSGLILLTYVESLKVHWQKIFSLFVIVGGVGILLMSSYLTCPPRTLYSQGLLLVIFYGYTMNRLLLIPATIAGLSITLFYTLTLLISDEISQTAIITSLFFQAAANIFGIFNILYKQKLLFHEYKLTTANFNKIKKIKKLNKKLLKLNTKLKLLASTDGLTGIANRRILDENLDAFIKISQKQKTPLTAVMLDIDYFKLYNDHYGHIQGDECLKSIASLLQQTIPESNAIVARFGGEEFCILLLNSNHQTALEITNDIQQKLADLAIEHKDSKVSEYVTASFGVTTACQDFHNLSAQKLITTVDKCLYQAKQNGRNQISATEI